MNALSMYRNLLRTARKYPSIKRDSILLEIKDAFRQNRSVTDPKQLDLLEEEATSAISFMSRYVSIQKNGRMQYC